MSKNNRSLLGIYTIGIAALFLLGFLLLVVFGAGSYQDSVGARESHSAQRVLLSYISTSVQQTELGHVRVEDAGQMLVLEDGDTGYVTRIYLADGRLIEEYRRDNTTPDPSQGRAIGKTKTFTVQTAADDLLKVTTDEGIVFVYVEPSTWDGGQSGAAEGGM